MVPTGVVEWAGRLVPGSRMRRRRPPHRGLDGPRSPGARPILRRERSGRCGGGGGVTASTPRRASWRLESGTIRSSCGVVPVL